MRKLLSIAVSIVALALVIFFILKWVDPTGPSVVIEECAVAGCEF